MEYPHRQCLPSLKPLRAQSCGYLSSLEVVISPMSRLSSGPGSSCFNSTSAGPHLLDRPLLPMAVSSWLLCRRCQKAEAHNSHKRAHTGHSAGDPLGVYNSPRSGRRRCRIATPCCVAGPSVLASFPDVIACAPLCPSKFFNRPT